MALRVSSSLFTFVLYSILFCDAEAWGHKGHVIIAALAEKNVSTAVLERCRKLLPDAMKSLVKVSSWADRVKSDQRWRWNQQLHYADTSAWKCSFNFTLDCADGSNCIVGAVANYTSRLQLPPSPSLNRTEDLMLLVHFVGDIVQPLHVAFHSDRGGNGYRGSFCRRKRTNLHAIWDHELITRRMLLDFHGSRDAYVEHLWQLPTDDIELCREDEDLSICIERWASDSALLACDYAYVDENGQAIASGFHLCEGYYNHVIKIVERQLITGGMRLAYLLDMIFASEEYDL